MLRYCERTVNNAICNKYGIANEDLEAKVSTWTVVKAGGDVISITIPKDTGGATTGDIEDLFIQAVGDDYAPLGYNIVPVQNLGDTNPTIILRPPSDASTAAASMLLLVIATAYLM